MLRVDEICGTRNLLRMAYTGNSDKNENQELIKGAFECSKVLIKDPCNPLSCSWYSPEGELTLICQLYFYQVICFVHQLDLFPRISCRKWSGDIVTDLLPQIVTKWLNKNKIIQSYINIITHSYSHGITPWQKSDRITESCIMKITPSYIRELPCQKGT